jgi:hypothetical protein
VNLRRGMLMNGFSSIACVPILLILAAPAGFAQQADQRSRGGAGGRTEIEIPLPISSPRALRPGTATPLSAKEKAALAFRNTFYPRTVASRVLMTGWDELRNSQPEWPGGAEGFGMRLGNRMGSLAVRQSIQLAGDTAFRTEPRYDLCECASAKGRMGHAWKRVFISMKDDGGEMVSVSRLGGAFVTPWITHQWLPDRENTTGQKLSSAGTNLMFRGLGNMLREFWPDIARKTRLPKFGAGRSRTR